MGKSRRRFPQGIALIARVALTIALLVWLGTWSENTFGAWIRALLPEGWYFTGLGLLSGIVVMRGVGLAANLFLVRWVVRLTESISERIPLITSLFQAFKDIDRLFSQDVDQQLGEFTVHVPKNRATPLDVPADQAMRAVLTGGSLQSAS